MRWEDERYVRVYTRDTGDWLTLSFEAQALFLMLLRKLDRIGELHLGKRGRATVPGLVGHAGKSKLLNAALDELLADGCVRVSEDNERLFVPNFLQAQEVAKSPAERKREQRERDAAKALENTPMSRDVTPVTIGHEMSPRSVPFCAEPTVPPVPEKPLSDKSDPLALAGLKVELVATGAEPGRRADDQPDSRPPSLPARAVFEHWRTRMGKNARAAFDGKRRRAVESRLKDGYSPEDLMRAVDGCAVTPHNQGQNDRGEKYDDLELICRDAAHVDRFMGNAKDPPKRAVNARFVNAQDVNQAAFDKVGAVNDF